IAYYRYRIKRNRVAHLGVARGCRGIIGIAHLAAGLLIAGTFSTFHHRLHLGLAGVHGPDEFVRRYALSIRIAVIATTGRILVIDHRRWSLVEMGNIDGVISAHRSAFTRAHTGFCQIAATEGDTGV